MHFKYFLLIHLVLTKLLFESKESIENFSLGPLMSNLSVYHVSSARGSLTLQVVPLCNYTADYFLSNNCKMASLRRTSLFEYDKYHKPLRGVSL